jgi:hypothetical protein
VHIFAPIKIRSTRARERDAPVTTSDSLSERFGREEVTYKFGAARRELWTCLIP